MDNNVRGLIDFFNKLKYAHKSGKYRNTRFPDDYTIRKQHGYTMNNDVRKQKYADVYIEIKIR